MSNFEKVRDLMVETLNLDADAITPESNLKEDLEIDSLDAVELIMNIEGEFDIEVPDDAVEHIATVDDILKLIEELSA